MQMQHAWPETSLCDEPETAVPGDVARFLFAVKAKKRSRTSWKTRIG